ncbi:N-hydroxyarylamine O-acetyltransferase [Jejubacter calystegiae]|uniref:N-hydroxyarylamine O-acetyltransferase n=1 Tax=Jejubacter calystegiae TaxID=2579935 RepID=A0A4P8YKQ2_9ENTR|nr:arylamine N-acetyltransferase [Jejubacter calystegiae]QCT21340.1 N-hydroxyarylamine O-acetyltransferase [Jejubacter calystegiae]
MKFCLTRYLTRIDYKGRAQADLATLRDIHLHHVCAIPFENLDVLLERPIQLDAESLFAKLVVARRGGYCFEQNGLLKLALNALGFDVEDLAARVLVMAPAEMPPRTHRLMRIRIDDQWWLADVGFGGSTLSAPIRLMADQPQQTPHGRYRLVRQEPGWLLQRWQEENWQPLYLFDLAMQYPSDYQMANHYVASWPESHFRHHLLMSRWLPDGGQLRLYNDRLTRCDSDGNEMQQLFNDSSSLFTALRQAFNLGTDDKTHGISETAFHQIWSDLKILK